MFTLVESPLDKALSVGESDDASVNQLIKDIQSSDGIETKTDMSPQQVVVFARAKIFSDRYLLADMVDKKGNKITIVDALLDKLMVYKKSENRKGMGELLTLFSGAVAMQIEKNKPKVEL